MEYIKIFIIIQFILFLLQFIKSTSLDSYQYYELVFGSFFLILIFGLLGNLITLEYLNPNSNLINNSALIASLYACWFYITKKLTNSINSDNNGVIYYN
jgi:hypothetical protein